jgi:uncharacterized membrane protein YfcA
MTHKVSPPPLQFHAAMNWAPWPGLSVIIAEIPHAQTAIALAHLFTFAIAILAGAVNSVAGGGTLLTFPVMLACGLDAKTANYTNTVGLLPAAFMGARGFSGGAGAQVRAMLSFYIVSMLGGAAGSVLLICTPKDRFAAIVPWLILAAALIFLLHDNISRHLFKKPPEPVLSVEKPIATEHAHPTPRIWALVFQFFVAVYGGYFGAGIGIMMLAALSLMGAGDIYRMNFLKNLASFVINGVSAVFFIAGGLVNWPIALSMALGAVIGGWFGAGIAKKVGPQWARRMVSAVGLSIAGYMMYTQFRGR